MQSEVITDAISILVRLARVRHAHDDQVAPEQSKCDHSECIRVHQRLEPLHSAGLHLRLHLVRVLEHLAREPLVVPEEGGHQRAIRGPSGEEQRHGDEHAMQSLAIRDAIRDEHAMQSAAIIRGAQTLLFRNDFLSARV